MFKFGVFYGPYFSAFELHKEIHTVNLRIQSKCGKKDQRNSEFTHCQAALLENYISCFIARYTSFIMISAANSQVKFCARFVTICTI